RSLRGSPENLGSDIHERERGSVLTTVAPAEPDCRRTCESIGGRAEDARKWLSPVISTSESTDSRLGCSDAAAAAGEDASGGVCAGFRAACAGRSWWAVRAA